MHRLVIALLAALDAVIAAAGGIAVVLAPLTLLWVFGLGGTADWGALWPASGAVWQLGHLVPLVITLPAEYLTVAGIDAAAASFPLSLAPLALATFTAVFAARSGRRAAQAGAPLTGAVSGSIVFSAIALVVALTTANAVAAVALWQAVLLPAGVFAVPALVGAIAAAWSIDDRGPVARLRDGLLRRSGAWGLLPGLLARGTAVAVAGAVGAGALVAGVAVLVSAGEIVSLYEASNVDLLGAVVLAVAQLAYLPTLVVWAMAFAAGPGFAVGGGAVSPAGTQVGVLPGIPVLGAVPESTTTWLLLLALLPVAVGALTGWMLRSRLAASGLAADGGTGVRAILAAGVAALTAAVAALLTWAASGAIGPGRLAAVGPEPGPVALTLGLEVLVGAAILLLAPRRAADRDVSHRSDLYRSDRAERVGDATPARSTDDARQQALWRSVSAPPMYVDDHRSQTAPVAELDPVDGAATADHPWHDRDQRGHEQDGSEERGPESHDDAAATEPIPGFERGSGGPTGEPWSDR